MYKLLKINSEDSWHFYYEYVCNINKDWKKSYILSCIFYKKEIIQQNDLSDYEFFFETHKNDVNNKYLLLVKDKPVTLISLMNRSDNEIDISFSTIKKEQNKGYATKAVKMIENIIFANPNITYTTIVDMNNLHISTKIAKNLGYEYDDLGGFFRKENPNLNKKHLLEFL